MSARDLYEQLITAWNSHDADAFAALFGSDGAMIGFDGSQATGPEIRAHLEAVFSDHETAPYVVKVQETRSLSADVEIVRAIVGMVPPRSHAVNPKANALQTLIAQGGRIVLFQNTPAQYHGRPELVDKHTAEIEHQLNTGQTVG